MLNSFSWFLHPGFVIYDRSIDLGVPRVSSTTLMDMISLLVQIMHLSNSEPEGYSSQSRSFPSLRGLDVSVLFSLFDIETCTGV